MNAVANAVPLDFAVDDGGRADAGFRGATGDCVVRAIAIATPLPYRQVYDELYAASAATRGRASENPSPRSGVFTHVLRPYLAALGFVWTPTMQIGSGCRVHLADNELPAGRLIVRLSRHITAVLDGTIRDTYDPRRGDTRCVYGFWRLP